MKVIQPVDTQQNLVIRARENAETVTLILRSKLGEETEHEDITTSYSGGLLTIPFTQDISEGENLDAIVKNGSAIIWRGRLYATAQSPATFKYFS